MLSVGSILKKERLKRGLSLKQVEKDIRIREKLLDAIEHDNWNFFSSKIYITGILNNYSKYLGLDAEKINAFFRRDYERREEVQFRKTVESKYLSPETKKVAYLSIGILFLIFFAYFTFQLFIFLAPPKVTILEPKTNTFRSVERVTVKGQVDKDASVTIYGDRVYQNKDGIFEYDFPLKKGLNNLSIEVTGANGKTTTIKKQYLLE